MRGQSQEETQQFLYAAPSFSFTVLCSSMGPLWVTVPSEEYLFHHWLIDGPQSLWEVPALLQSSPSPLTLLFPLLFPLFFPHPPSLILSMLSPPQHFQPLLRHFHRATASLADGLSGGLWWVPCKDSWSTCVWHRASPGLLPQRPHLKLLCCQALPFTSSTASKG